MFIFFNAFLDFALAVVLTAAHKPGSDTSVSVRLAFGIP